MKAQGRKNVHGKAGVKFKSRYNAERKISLLRNVITKFIIHEKITLTSGLLKDFIKKFDNLVTLAKKNRHNLVNSFLRNEKDSNGQKAIKKFFDVIVPRFKDRNGGYVKHFKYVNRRGDGAKQIIITLAD